MNSRKYPERGWIHIASMPFIWAPLPFVMMVDLFIEIYHQVGFPMYRLEKVKRGDYISITDRYHLSYLTFPEKLGCMYCGYVNGVVLYWKEIAARTEKYWCGIMHQGHPEFKRLEYQKKLDFAEYNDERDFEQKYLPQG